MTCDSQTYQNVKGSLTGLQQNAAFDAAIAWREYAGYLETELDKYGRHFAPIANNVFRTYPPKKVETTVYE